jgi:Predicted Rossmann fold nucleotide-binding protein involved in DNA uptake
MTKVAPYRLAERDQWQSGLSDKVIVLETNENSGTNITIEQP